MAAPHGKLKLLCTTGQSEAIGAWWPACEVHVCTYTPQCSPEVFNAAAVATGTDE